MTDPGEHRDSKHSNTSTVQDIYYIQDPDGPREGEIYREHIRDQMPPGVLATKKVSIRSYSSKELDLEAVPSRTLSSHSEKHGMTHYVNWEKDDPECPYNWSTSYRYFHTMSVAILVVSAAFGSSVITGRLNGVVESFGCTQEVAILQVSLMVFGFMIGPLLWSPTSEIWGRKPIYVIALGLYTVFNIPCAVAKNIETVLVARFFSGFFASASLTLAGGSISDLFPTETRGFAVAYFAAAPYAGPVLGPLVGGWISVGTQNWRWIYWVNMIFAGVTWILVCILPETYHPVLLAKRAKSLREKTGDSSYVTVEEEIPIPISELVQANLIRPFVMLLTEPILMLMSLYVAIIYALLYAFFFAYPIVFGKVHGMNDGLIGLTFIGILIGAGFALLVTPYFERLYAKTIARNGKALPEDRLVCMMFAAPFVPVSLFIFGWTSFPWVHWIAPTLSGIPFGFGMVLIYYSANNYLIDCFSRYVTSALASKVLIRSGSGAAFPLFIEQMYAGMGNQWASTLLAFISLAIVPIPFAFYKWGAKIRAQSKTAS